jgi:hypothetical protein
MHVPPLTPTGGAVVVVVAAAAVVGGGPGAVRMFLNQGAAMISSRDIFDGSMTENAALPAVAPARAVGPEDCLHVFLCSFQHARWHSAEQ